VLWLKGNIGDHLYQTKPSIKWSLCMQFAGMCFPGLVPLSIPTAYAAAYGGRSFPLASLPGYYIPGRFIAAGLHLAFGSLVIMHMQ